MWFSYLHLVFLPKPYCLFISVLGKKYWKSQYGRQTSAALATGATTSDFIAKQKEVGLI